MVRWLRWHCPPDTGFEIRALAVWGRARYLSVMEAPHNTNFHTWMGKKQFVSFKPPRPGTEPRTLAWKAAVLTTTLGPPPRVIRDGGQTSTLTQLKYFYINHGHQRFFSIWNHHKCPSLVVPLHLNTNVMGSTSTIYNSFSAVIDF